MRKAYAFIFLTILFAIGLTGCLCSTPDDNAGNDETDTEYVFEADVIEAGERLLVSPDKDSPEYLSSDRISVGLSEVNDKPELIKPGDRIRIYYNGLIAESYPARISANKIELIGHNKKIDGFITLIDDIYNEDPALNDSIAMIAFNIENTEILSETEIETILAVVKNEYGLKVIRGTFDELADQGLIDREHLYFEKGILIEIKNIDTDKNGNKITASISKWRSGLGAIGWNAEALFEDDNWTVTRHNSWIS